MNNALDYIAWRGDLTFDRSPVNEVDIFIFSQLCTPDYTGIVLPGSEIPLPEVSERYFKTHADSAASLGKLQSEYVLPMLKAAPETMRFGSLKLSDFVNRIDQKNIEQFCAVTVILPDGTRCVSFRGTDDTIIGWKEDCYLAIKETVPAQRDALAYLISAASKSDGDIIVCGHSKGGNLALYAAVYAPPEVSSRIVRAVSYDGPGFNPDFFNAPGFDSVRGRLTTIISQNSIIGTLLNQAGEVVTVNSCRSGPNAHDGFTWEVLGNGFVRARGLSEASRNIKKAMDGTLAGMTFEERQAFVDELFDSLLSTGAVTITELADGISSFSLQKAFGMFKSFRDDRLVFRFLQTVMDNLVDSAKAEAAAKIDSAKAEAAAMLDTAKTGAAARLDSAKAEAAARIDSAKAEAAARIDARLSSLPPFDKR